MAMKIVLRTFELSSGLRVNFSKSSLIGVDVSDDFLAMDARFVHCERCSLPFKYLGFPVGPNPRTTSTWDHMLHVIKIGIRGWQYRSSILGGRIVLVKSFLSSIPIFHLSFKKLPRMYRKRLLRYIGNS